MEFALVAPLLLALLLGVLTGGIALDRKQTVTQTAREGARYGATVAQNQCASSSDCSGMTWAQLVQTVAAARSGGVITATDICVALVTGTPGVVVGAGFTTKADGTPCYTDGIADGGTRVQVSITQPGASIDAVFVRIPLTLRAQATARFEQ